MVFFPLVLFVVLTIGIITLLAGISQNINLNINYRDYFFRGLSQNINHSLNINYRDYLLAGISQNINHSLNINYRDYLLAGISLNRYDWD
jgi:hypothetical protein